ncbi:MAG: hypothetical protein SWY16_23650 [Cyanobacteriota bacterium]|nr:hypothetical protein [Cyanobacteriota bacterium]
MVNSAAGLAGKYLGRDKRTLVINASTNNPELFLMILSLSLFRLGGIATPLGSNFSNIYLMFLVAPAIVIFKWMLAGKFDKVSILLNLVKKERKLVIWHFFMSLMMFVFSSAAYWCLTGAIEFIPLGEDSSIRKWPWLIFGGVVCCVGVFLFFRYERRLKIRRPELFEDINEENYEASWFQFFLGTAALVASCYILNSLFLAWTEVYAGPLSRVFGTAVFAGLHYFLGSLISSLPETTVAVENYERLTSPDLNTALASASQSNMTNLAIGCLGSLLASLLLLAGMSYQL